MSSAQSPSSGLAVQALSAAYGPVQALTDVTLHVERGAHLFLAGPSGSGKSTLLRCIAGLHMPGAGHIAWNNEPWTDAETGSSRAPEARRIGWMTQQPALWPHLTALKHLRTTLAWRGIPRSERAAEAQRLLEIVQLFHRATHRPAQLSGGEAQRLALARALCGHPQIVLLDEPLGQLDVLLRRSIAQVIREATAAIGATVLHVTHDPAGIMSDDDRIGIIEEGRLVGVATVAELRRDPPTRFAAAVVGSHAHDR